MAAPVSLAPILPPSLADFGGRVGITGKPTLQSAAQEVETLFLSMLLKEMRQSLGSEDQEGMFAGDSADIYGGLFDLYLGKHLADAGGVGLASTWAKQLEQEQATHDTAGRSAFGADLPGPSRP